ncbi:hypothetical protein HYN56_19795 [Flavobacterium crocinum]|uniref:Thiopeptide-type bacteriocin biosynthesis domain-containing protein n=1 Tax=Flavobacterium crocinum TaxID=2183896 RepID=A0A2S1YQI1_9FLAO|nr:thiopeptide-type bacteriocin biosynthesis protein [Flavobacterium crocinum]AWK06347.1 hypothetical protein HYN56_19795 [Flavobacterium crocinum]
MSENKVNRNYYFGSEWLYYKIYLGEDTSDKVLLEVIKPIADIFLKKGYISKWFYIRYYDPDSHIRIRFNLTTTNNISEIAKIIHEKLKYYVSNHFIHKIQIDTYKREIERYGLETIEDCETLFYANSKFNLSLIKKFSNTDQRWLFGMKFIDEFLNDCEYNLKEKRELIEILKNGFASEFQTNKNINQSLSQKYRTNKEQIFLCLENRDVFFDKLFKEHRKNSQNAVIKIKEKEKDGRRRVDYLIDSLLHMHCNRLFKNKQRLHEWVIYDLLYRYYDGKYSRTKYETGDSRKSFKE